MNEKWKKVFFVDVRRDPEHEDEMEAILHCNAEKDDVRKIWPAIVGEGLNDLSDLDPELALEVIAGVRDVLDELAEKVKEKAHEGQ